MRSAEEEVVIVGAGVVGACMALALAQAGFRVLLIEAREPANFNFEHEIDSRVFAISNASYLLFRKLGVWQNMSAMRVSPYQTMRVWENDADLHFTASLIGTTDLGWIVEHRVLQAALWQALQAQTMVRIVCPESITSIELIARGYRLQLQNNSDCIAPLLLVADGANSNTRNMLNISATKKDFSQTAIVAHVHTEFAHQQTAWQRFLPTGPLALLPLSDGRCSIVWSLDQAHFEVINALSDENFNRELTLAFGARLGRIKLSTARASFPLQQNLADQSVLSRAVLLGDCAHMVHPLAGQGLNLGLQDVAVLYDVLVQAKKQNRDIFDSRVLAKFARARDGKNARAATMFGAIQKLFGQSSWWLERLRSESLGLLSAHNSITRILVEEANGLGGSVPSLMQRQ